jgi:hypothetical protein
LDQTLFGAQVEPMVLTECVIVPVVTVRPLTVFV